MKIGVLVGTIILFSLIMAPIVLILDGNWFAATVSILVLAAIFLQRSY